jgi:metal-responsive CopG/Arc/MetJ family transcriptional regulator
MKRTYVLPQETVAQFEQVVPARQRSATIDNLLREWLDRQRRERLRQEVIAGCEAMAEIYLAIEREYHPLEEEVHRGLDA